MIDVTVLWSNGENAHLDQEYYLGKHIPMLRELLGDRLKKVEVQRGLGGLEPNSPAPYVFMTHLLFESLEDFQEGFATHGDQIQGDTPISPTFRSRCRSPKWSPRPLTATAAAVPAEGCGSPG